jgi:cytidine deaminase
MQPDLALVPAPELVIGLVAPIGVNLDLVSDALSKALDVVGYQHHDFRITQLMREIFPTRPIPDRPFIVSYKARIAYANEVREKLGPDALAKLAILAIRKLRREINETESRVGEQDEYRPLSGRAYIIRQFKNPHEINLLRRVYGGQFILISAYAPASQRIKVITERERRSTNSRTSRVSAENLANELVAQDSREEAGAYGQNVRDAFPLADVIVDATSPRECTLEVNRFINLLFGNNQISPSRAEYGMYMAKASALRSTDLSRQVGAAIFLPSGEIATLGTNEVPKAGGGTYWTSDANDARDHVRGFDPNEQRQSEILVNLLGALKNQKHLSEPLLEIADPGDIASKVLSEKGVGTVSESMLMDILEFSRVIHAEMSAITDAARRGITLKDATLYCTTFPCHMCAKHIVAAGISSVVYLEPYSKSYAQELHSDSIVIDSQSSGFVSFQTFTGIAPIKYRELFERRGKRKDSAGIATEWLTGAPRPNIELYYPTYRDAEELATAPFADQIAKLATDESKL